MEESKKNVAGKFCGYASIFNIKDYYNDIVLPLSFKHCFKQKKISDIKFLFQHNSQQEIGHFTKLKENETGLFVEGYIDISKNAKLYQLIKNNCILGLSIGFILKKSKFNHKNERILEEIDLKEISLVSQPANKLSKIIYCK